MRLSRRFASPAASPAFPSGVDALWNEALAQYHRSLAVNLRDPSNTVFISIQHCSTPEEILDVLQEVTGCLRDKRLGGRTSRLLRMALRPLVRGLTVILDAGAETASAMGVPGGKGIFVAIAVLLKAADNVSARFDDLRKLFERLAAYVVRLQTRLQAPMSFSAREIAVRALVEMLKALALATKMLRKNRIELFLEALFADSHEVRLAIEGLEVIVADEERMAVTDVVVGMHKLSSQVLDIGTTLSRLFEGNIRSTQLLLGEIRNNEAQRSSDNHITLELLRTIAAHLKGNIHSGRPFQAESDFTTAGDEDGTQRVVRGRSSDNSLPVVIRRVRRVVSRFSQEDQDIIYRTLSTLFSWALEVVNSRHSSTSQTTATLTPVYYVVVEGFLSIACTVLVLFMMWKLASITRPLGLAPGTVIVIGLCDEIFVLDFDTFSTWENTHAYLLRAFQGRLGSSYVARRAYGLGDSEHLLIGQDEWSDIVKAGSHLHMSVIVREKRCRCPYCGATSGTRGPSSDDERVVCSRCRRSFGAFMDKVEQESSDAGPSSLGPRSTTDQLSYMHSDVGVTESVDPFHRVLLALDRDTDEVHSMLSEQLERASSNDPDFAQQNTSKAADFWVPQMRPSGQIFYLNTVTGKSARELPADDDTETRVPDVPGVQSRVHIPEPRWRQSLEDERMTSLYSNTEIGQKWSPSHVSGEEDMAMDDHESQQYPVQRPVDRLPSPPSQIESDAPAAEHVATTLQERPMPFAFGTKSSVQSSLGADKVLRVLGDAPAYFINNLNTETRPWYLKTDYEEGKDIIIDPSGKVYGGTVPALVEHLVACEHIDAGFTETFMTTFETFMDLDSLITHLMKWFWIAPPDGLTNEENRDWLTRKRHTMRARVLSAFKSIIEDDVVLEKTIYGHGRLRLEQFARHEVVQDLAAGRQLLEQIEQTRSRHNAESKMAIACNLRPIPIAIFDPKLPKPKLTGFDPLEVARQLTMVECALFSKIKASECLSRSWVQQGGSDTISAVISMSNKIAYWVADTILDKGDARKRALVIKYFIQVADHCRDIQNFSSMFAIVSGLNLSPIRRLKRTWDMINHKCAGMLSACEMTIGSGKNFVRYRQLLQAIAPPCVPFFGIYLTTLKAVHNSVPDTIAGNLVNFRKREKAAEVIKEIRKWQSKPPNFARVELIADYLHDNLNKFNNVPDVNNVFWNRSLEREPREREGEKMTRLLQETGFL